MRYVLLFFLLLTEGILPAAGQSPENLQFIRQGVRRFVFDESHSIPLAALHPREAIGINAMYPAKHHLSNHARLQLDNNQLIISSGKETLTSVWFGGLNPFAVYTIDMAARGEGTIGLEFSPEDQSISYRILLDYRQHQVLDIREQVVQRGKVELDRSIALKAKSAIPSKGKFLIQMLGSGLTVYWQDKGLPVPVAQAEFSQLIDLRKVEYIHSFQSRLYLHQKKGRVELNSVKSDLSSGIGQADIRAITYEDGSPLLDQGRLWYTMSIRGRALPHHIQGVFSLNPGSFDLRFEGVILFDRKDGIWRNEIASHIFYDRRDNIWRGITTGFSAYALPGEKKQLLAVESRKDPRFGFSVMDAYPFGVVGDIEDPHILFDSTVNKWRILTCENIQGYKAIMLESDHWNKGYTRIAGPVAHNSTGTSIQQINGKRYCFSGSQDRKIYIYSYPELSEIGVLNMDLPPWDAGSGTRVWPNVVELPEGYPFRYVALMMDRYNYPGLEGPNWTYGALYLYHAR
jgi:hypothetical protein